MSYRKFTKYDIQKSLNGLKRHFHKKSSELLYELSIEIIINFLGFKWAENNVFGFNPMDKFLRSTAETSEERYKHQDRIINLADMFFNLQCVEGFDSKVKELETSSIEAAVAEFEGAKFLFKMDLPFKFVIPKGKKGNDFDVAIYLDNKSIIPCDMKCKIEETELSKTTILNTIKKAKKQLPKTNAGILFVKIPENWVNKPELFDIISDALQNFFRNTSRVTVIFFHWEEWEFFPNIKYAKRSAKFNYFINEYSRYKEFISSKLLNKISGIYFINKWEYLAEIVK